MPPRSLSPPLCRARSSEPRRKERISWRRGRPLPSPLPRGRRGRASGLPPFCLTAPPQLIRREENPAAVTPLLPWLSRCSIASLVTAELAVAVSTPSLELPLCHCTTWSSQKAYGNFKLSLLYPYIFCFQLVDELCFSWS
ncbi:hypothetical protein AHAS_Ahas10G0063000 [Arachis hypogaea]